MPPLALTGRPELAQQHLDRLTSIDASFLHQEGHASHMHIGGVLIFEGPVPDFDDYLDHVRGRLHLVPPTALPAPGTEDQLFLLASRIASQQLDRSKPLWENWLVEGLQDGRFALISKTHPALVDRISGGGLAS